MTKLRVCATWISVLLGAVSAFCWWRSAVTRVPHFAGADTSGAYADGSFAADGADLVRTIRLQSKWNRWAAIAASGAAIAAAVAQTVSAIDPN